MSVELMAPILIGDDEGVDQVGWRPAEEDDVVAWLLEHGAISVMLHPNHGIDLKPGRYLVLWQNDQ